MSGLNVSDGKNKNIDDASGDENEDSTVSREAYNRAIAQRKADKVKREAAERERDELKAKMEEQETERLAKQNEFQKLYETEKKKREEAEGKLSEMSQGQINSAKKQALNNMLGLKKDEYMKFAKLGDIQMNEDGSVDQESVKKVANAFRAEYPELLPTKEGSKLPIESGSSNIKPKPAKALKDMSEVELREAFKQHRQAEQVKG